MTEPVAVTVFACPAGCVCHCPDGPCGHVWDGPERERYAGRVVSVTCSRCGAWAIDHDARVCLRSFQKRIKRG